MLQKSLTTTNLIQFKEYLAHGSVAVCMDNITTNLIQFKEYLAPL